MSVIDLDRLNESALSDIEICNLGTTQFKEDAGLACTTICLYWADYLLSIKKRGEVRRRDLVRVMRDACIFWKINIRRSQHFNQVMETNVYDHLNLSLVDEKWHNPREDPKRGLVLYYPLKTAIEEWVKSINHRRARRTDYPFCEEILIIVAGSKYSQNAVSFTYVFAVYGYSLAFIDSHDGVKVTARNLNALFDYLSTHYSVLDDSAIIDYHWMQRKPSPPLYFSTLVTSPLSTPSSSAVLPYSYYNHLESLNF